MLGSFYARGVGVGSSLLGEPLRRKAFFSFHFDDVFRVNNVRQSWRFQRSDLFLGPSFMDSSLWESSQRENEESLKDLIRNGVSGTSAVCVLIGTETWTRRWVKYEIARALIDNRGLLAVHLNKLPKGHHRVTDEYEVNPLLFMGITKCVNGKFYICELKSRVVSILPYQIDWYWEFYADYTYPITVPRYMPEPQLGRPISLAEYSPVYCFIADRGSVFLGSWLDYAAKRAGR
jgi:hypothetical protein